MKMNNIMIKKLFLYVAVVAVFMTGCAKSEKTSSRESTKRYLDAWISINHPDATSTELGTYILDDEPGTGSEYEEKAFIIVKYTIRDLEGNVTSTTDKKIAQRIGDYNPSYYYGNQVWLSGEGSLPIGVEDMLDGMKVGGTRTALIPSWLFTTNRYKNKSDYFKKKLKNEGSSAIYTVTLEGFTDNILDVECDSMRVYSKKYLDGVDTTSYGFYYKSLVEPADTHAFSSDTSIYINYTGRLLNRQVFDTTDPDTAKMYNIYSSSKTYSPVEINWSDEYSNITMSSDSSSDTDLITGFKMTLWKMRKYEKGVGMFFSPYGYASSGSGNTIPAYAPLVFEIEIVDKPED